MKQLTLSILDMTEEKIQYWRTRKLLSLACDENVKPKEKVSGINALRY